MKAGGTSKELPEELSRLTEKFAEAMDDDFNTPKALAVLFDAARSIKQAFFHCFRLKRDSRTGVARRREGRD